MKRLQQNPAIATTLDGQVGAGVSSAPETQTQAAENTWSGSDGSEWDMVTDGVAEGSVTPAELQALALKVDEMLGSYAPDPSKVNSVIFPRREWEEAPSGMMARGTYTAKTTFVDDDKKEHLAFEYKLKIAKDW